MRLRLSLAALSCAVLRVAHALWTTTVAGGIGVRCTQVIHDGVDLGVVKRAFTCCTSKFQVACFLTACRPRDSIRVLS